MSEQEISDAYQILDGACRENPELYRERFPVLESLMTELNLLRGLANRSPRLQFIREQVAHVQPVQEFPVAVSAMQERELLQFISRYDTTQTQAEEAYDALRKIDSVKYVTI